MNISKFTEEFNSRFSNPFLPKNFVKARIISDKEGEYLNIKIGDRDVDFDMKSGESIGSGTDINDASKWNIIKK